MASPASSQVRKTMIVVADDFAPFRSFIRLKLSQSGFQNVIEATDGLEAVSVAAELRPDLVLLDIAMPNLNGLEAAAKIRLCAPESKILFVSQNTDPDLVEAALSDGASGYVWKSRVERELLPAIEAVLSGAKYVNAGRRPATKVNFS